MALTTPITPTLPDEELRQIEGQITELAAHIHAANYRLLNLIRCFDAAGGWSGPGLRSCAHRLNWKCGIGLNAAREGNPPDDWSNLVASSRSKWPKKGGDLVEPLTVTICPTSPLPDRLAMKVVEKEYSVAA